MSEIYNKSICSIPYLIFNKNRFLGVKNWGKRKNEKRAKTSQRRLVFRGWFCGDPTCGWWYGGAGARCAADGTPTECEGRIGVGCIGGWGKLILCVLCVCVCVLCVCVDVTVARVDVTGGSG